MGFVYNISIFLYQLAIRIVSIFSPKARLWIKGRNDILSRIEEELNNNQAPVIWIHCASLGEFEQGRPLIEQLKITHPGHKLFLTFFSPSGYEIRKNYKEADWIFYLPMDTPSNAKKFINTINPSIVFFVKYEFWFNYLNELKNRAIPTYLISGIFRESQHFFKFYGSWSRKQLHSFTHFFLQNKQSEILLNSIGYHNTTVTGDTRFDRVDEIAQTIKTFPLIVLFCNKQKVFIAGSTWEEDERVIASITKLLNGYKIIVAPHEIGSSHIEKLTDLFKGFNTIKYSELTEENAPDKTILIIDNIGMLSSLYQYGTIAYIGGGFGKGIHNILEAATFGLPVIFGPNYHKFTEAKEMLSLKAAFTINDNKDLEFALSYLNKENNRADASSNAKRYVQSNIGATKKILSFIK